MSLSSTGNTKIIKMDISLFDWQRDCINLIFEYPSATHICKSKRQCGKSIMAELIILKVAIEKKHSKSMFVSPTFKQATKVYNDLVSAILGSCIVKKFNNLTLEIKLINDSVIQFFSAEQKLESLQGFTTTGILIVDEACFIPDEIFYTILPWTNATNAPILCISTPRYKAGFFYDFYCDGLAGSDEIKVFDFCKYDTSALLSAARLEYYRKRLPVDLFTLMYKGEFTESSGSVFSDFSDCLYEPTDADYAKKCVFSIDWGSGQGQDETAISIITEDFTVLLIVHFSDKDETETIKLITEMARQYRPMKITVEKNSIGQIYYGLLKKSIQNSGLDIPVIPFVTTNDSKHLLVSELLVMIQNKEIKLPKDDLLNLQLSQYEMVLSKNNKPVYNGKTGTHDDMLMSLMIGVHSLIKKKRVTFV